MSMLQLFTSLWGLFSIALFILILEIRQNNRLIRQQLRETRFNHGENTKLHTLTRRRIGEVKTRQADEERDDQKAKARVLRLGRR